MKLASLILAWALCATPALAEPPGRVGTVFPTAEIPVVTQSGGRITRLAVAEGDRVKRGQLLLSLDRTRMAEEVRMLESQIAHRAALRLEQMSLAVAKQDLVRDEALYADKNLPLRALEESRNRMRLATEREAIERDRLKEQEQLLVFKKKMMQELDVLAPADGVMASVLLHPNQVIASGAKVGDLLRIDQVIVETFVPLKQAHRLRPGQRVMVRSEQGDLSLEGQIKVLGEKVDPVASTIRVKVNVNNAGRRLKPGMMVRVQL